MKFHKYFLMILPLLGIAVDSVFGSGGLSWLFIALPVILPTWLMVLLAATTISIIEILFGASREKLIKRLGYIVACFVPALILAETWNMIAESELLEMPKEDVYRILTLQFAQIVLAIGIHFMIISKAPIILALYSGDNVDKYFAIPYWPDEDDEAIGEENTETEEENEDFNYPGPPGFTKGYSPN